MKRAVVLLSGGLDSATTLAVAIAEGFHAHALTIDYGQRHYVEVQAAARVATALQAQEHRMMEFDLRCIGGSALTDEIEVPKNREEAGIPSTYVPARNTIMLAIALGYAETIGADDIFIGVNAVDYSGYPDCRPEFIGAFETLANLATKRAVEGNRIKIHAPLLSLSKVGIIKKGLELGVDYGLTHSCYDPDPDPCGHCDSCLIRQRAFAEVGMEDPALART